MEPEGDVGIRHNWHGTRWATIRRDHLKRKFVNEVCVHSVYNAAKNAFDRRILQSG